jgi:hypothetical protein
MYNSRTEIKIYNSSGSKGKPGVKKHNFFQLDLLRWPALGYWQPHSWSSDVLVSAAQSSAATQPLRFSAQAASSVAALADVEEVAVVDAVEEAAVDDVVVVAAVAGVVVVVAAADGDVVAVDAAAAAVPVAVAVAAAVVDVEAGVETFLQSHRMEKYIINRN